MNKDMDQLTQLRESALQIAKDHGLNTIPVLMVMCTWMLVQTLMICARSILEKDEL
jgi:hypothetical protein